MRVAGDSSQMGMAVSSTYSMSVMTTSWAGAAGSAAQPGPRILSLTAIPWRRSSSLISHVTLAWRRP
eukprot:5879343-Alexandrium_andersonii.AAC.1